MPLAIITMSALHRQTGPPDAHRDRGPLGPLGIEAARRLGETSSGEARAARRFCFAFTRRPNFALRRCPSERDTCRRAVSGLGTGTRVSLLGRSASVDGPPRRKRSSSATLSDFRRRGLVILERQARLRRVKGGTWSSVGVSRGAQRADRKGRNQAINLAPASGGGTAPSPRCPRCLLEGDDRVYGIMQQRGAMNATVFPRMRRNDVYRGRDRQNGRDLLRCCVD